MAVLAAETLLTTNGEYRTLKVKAGVADTFYKGAILSFLDATADGVTPVTAAGLRFAGICEETVTAAVGDEITVAIDGLWQLPVAVANAYDAQGELVHADVSAGSDNPADLVVTTATGDYGVGRCVKWRSATSLLVDIAVRTAHTVAA